MWLSFWLRFKPTFKKVRAHNRYTHKLVADTLSKALLIHGIEESDKQRERERE